MMDTFEIYLHGLNKQINFDNSIELEVELHQCI